MQVMAIYRTEKIYLYKGLDVVLKLFKKFATNLKPHPLDKEVQYYHSTPLHSVERGMGWGSAWSFFNNIQNNFFHFK